MYFPSGLQDDADFQWENPETVQHQVYMRNFLFVQHAAGADPDYLWILLHISVCVRVPAVTAMPRACIKNASYVFQKHLSKGTW